MDQTGFNSRRVLCLLIMLFGLAVPPAPAADTIIAEADVRRAVTRSVPFIKEHGSSWIENRGCVSCHRIGMMTWSLSDAARHGFDVNPDQLNEWIDWSLAALLAEDEQKQQPVGSRNPEGMDQLLLSRHREVKSDARREAYDAFVTLLVAEQNSVGFWKPGGQLPQQKRSDRETTEVSTMWNTLALLDVRDPAADVTAAIQRAAERIVAAKPGSSTEWHVTRLLFALKHRPSEDQLAWQESLRALQQSDGGWGWLVDESSDALATGMAVYALRQAGVESSDPVVQSALKFLLDTQKDDGSWDVHGTKDDKRESIEETAVFWGTTWATIGMLQTLPAVDGE